MSPPTLRVIVNPRAGRGLDDVALRDLHRRFEAQGLDPVFMLTAAPGHARQLAETARGARVDVLAVVGGDGTMNEVVQAFIDAEGTPIPGPALAIVPTGTGGDFRRTLGLGRDLDEAVGRIRFGADHPADLGLLRFVDHEGSPSTRAFLNVASAGLGGLVDRIVNASGKHLGGSASFFLGAARGLMTYRNQPVCVRVDGALVYEGRALSVAVANGRFFGGGMCIAPMADPGDGRLEIVVVGDLARHEIPGFAARLYRGAHLSSPGVHVAHGRRVEVDPLDAAPLLLDCDGEAIGRAPATFTILPHALRFRR